MTDADDVLADLREQFAKAAEAGEFDEQLDDFMENRVVPVWQANSPVDTDAYKESVSVTQRAQGGRGQVGATVDYANIVEYGAEHITEDGSEPTPEYAPRAKTEAHFANGAAE